MTGRLPLGLLFGAGALSCSPPSRPTPAPPPATAAIDACALSTDSAQMPDTLTLALSGNVDPADAPVPATDAEQMAFRQLYETLVRLDCAGVPQPALAATWASGESGRRWTFTLRSDARFWDGTSVTVRDVIASWTVGDIALLSGATFEAPDDHTLVVHLANESPTLLRQLADPALSVTQQPRQESWPVGTGNYRADTSAGRVILSPVLGLRRPVLVLRPLVPPDARDWLDRGIDLLVTDDAAALSYAASRPDLHLRPLPWDRTYVLLARGSAPAVTPAWREGLARDAVHVDARPAETPVWWTAFPECVGPPPEGAPLAPLSRPLIVYPRDDGTARDLAGRLVALEGGSTGTAVRVAGLAPGELAAALASGQSAQFVIPVPREVPGPCRAVRRLVARAPWLSLVTQIVPLVDTRRQVVWRRGAVDFTVDWDATLRAR